MWLGNGRGNKYSKSHKIYDPSKDAAEFWDYSFTDMGKYDLTAEIEYVLKHTGAAKL